MIVILFIIFYIAERQDYEPTLVCLTLSVFYIFSYVLGGTTWGKPNHNILSPIVGLMSA